MNYSEIRKKVTPAYKEKFLITIYRELSLPVVKILMNTKVTPNTISYLNIAVAVLTAITFAFRMPLLGVPLLFLWKILDCVDGGLARIKNSFSKYGSFLDYVGDKTLPPLLFIMMGVGYDMFLLSLIPASLYCLTYYPKMIGIKNTSNTMSMFGSGIYLPIFITIVFILPISNIYSVLFFFIIMTGIYSAGTNMEIFSLKAIKEGYESSIKKIKNRRHMEE